MKLRNPWPFQRDPLDTFERLVKPHLKRLYNLAYRYTANAEDAEDLVQETLLRLYPRLDELREIEKPGPWMARILYRLFIDHYRRTQRSPVDLNDDEASMDETNFSDDFEPMDFVLAETEHKLLNLALGRLDEEHRIMIMMHDVEGYTLQEIQQIIDVPIGTLKSRLSRSRKKLRDLLQNWEPYSRYAV